MPWLDELEGDIICPGSVTIHCVTMLRFRGEIPDPLPTQNPGRIQKVDPLMGVPIKYP